jgi:integrase
MRELIAVYEREHLSSLSIDRRRTAVRVLDEFASTLDSAHGSTNALRLLLGSLLERGYADGTLQKTRAVVLGFATWAWREGQISGDELLALRDVRLMGAPSREATPQPYRPTELRQLRAVLAERWPVLDEYTAARWLSRFRESRSPYSRVRTHVIGCQIRAAIALALELGLRRREIYALIVDGAHPDNSQIVVFRDMTREVETCRAVPNRTTTRRAVARWLACRNAIAPPHNAVWLNTHAGPTCARAMTAATFNRLLGTYVGVGWTLKRLRDTCAVAWVRTGLAPDKLQELLGVARVEDVLPFYRHIGGSLADEMDARDDFFDELIGAVRIRPIAA